jgi:hypothetical protein
VTTILFISVDDNYDSAKPSGATDGITELTRSVSEELLNYAAEYAKIAALVSDNPKKRRKVG